MRTAGDVLAAARSRAVTQSIMSAVTIGGFIVVHSNRRDLPMGSPCALTVLMENITVRLAQLPTGIAYAFRDLHVMEVSGRGMGRRHSPAPRTWRGRIVSAVVGESRAAGDAVLRLRSDEDRVVLKHERYNRAQLQRACSEALARWEVLRTASGAVGSPPVESGPVPAAGEAAALSHGLAAETPGPDPPVGPQHAPRPLIWTSSPCDGTVVIRVGGEIDIVGAVDLGVALSEERACGHHVLLDLGRLTAIDAAGIAVLIRAREEFARDELRLELYRSLRPEVRRELLAAGVLPVLPARR